MDVDLFIKEMSPLLKAHGFKKASSTWRRDQGESIAVLNVQKSPWGGNTYYVNIGTYFSVLGSEKSPTENKCHVQLRLEIGDPTSVVTAAIEWFEARASLKDAAALAEADSKKGLVFKELRGASTT